MLSMPGKNFSRPYFEIIIIIIIIFFFFSEEIEVDISYQVYPVPLKGSWLLYF